MYLYLMYYQKHQFDPNVVHRLLTLNFVLSLECEGVKKFSKYLEVFGHTRTMDTSTNFFTTIVSDTLHNF